MRIVRAEGDGAYVAVPVYARLADEQDRVLVAGARTIASSSRAFVEVRVGAWPSERLTVAERDEIAGLGRWGTM